MASHRYPAPHPSSSRIRPADLNGRSGLTTLAGLLGLGLVVAKTIKALSTHPAARRPAVSRSRSPSTEIPRGAPSTSGSETTQKTAPASATRPSAQPPVGERAQGDSRGRNAQTPEQIPARGWWDVLVRVYQDLGRDNASLVAAGLAMYAMLSIFPALTALVSIYGLFVSPAGVVQQMRAFAATMPPDMWHIITSQLQSVASKQAGTLSVAAGISILVALWSARSGMSSLMTAMNIAFAEQERRGIVRQVLISLLFTLGAVVAVLIMLGRLVAVPIALRFLGTAAWISIAGQVLRFLLLGVFAVLALSCVYRFGPSRAPIRWRWVTWGSTIAALLWVIASALFAVYVQKFAGYQKAYGALGGVIVMLMWLYLSSYIILLGAELNAEMERQTRQDTTDGRPKPMGQRRAFAADTIGPPAEAARSSEPASTHTV